jgi:hypothetical protein
MKGLDLYMHPGTAGTHSQPRGKGRLTHDFSGPLASRNPNTGNNSKSIGFQNRFDAFDKRKNNRGFEHENMRTTSKK